MSDNHPSNYDPVIGGQEISLSPVLGGIEAIKSALRSNDYEVRIRALNDALNYGEDGANLLITVMKKDKDWRVQYEAWKILLESGNTSVKDFQIPCRKIDNIRARYKAGERDFRWADLREAKLRWADLSKADLSGANLYRARLYEADLSETNLTGANLGRANLTWANLSGANLSQADLSGASLSGANLNQADLSGAYLYGVIVDESTQIDPKWRLVCEIFNQDGYQKNLRNIDLSGTNLSEANLEGTDLTGAILSGANLNQADLKGANVQGAKLRGADSREANYTNAKMSWSFLLSYWLVKGVYLLFYSLRMLWGFLVVLVDALKTVLLESLRKY